MSLFTTLDHLEYPFIQPFQNLDGTFLDGFYEVVSNIPAMLAVSSLIIYILYLRDHRLWRPILGALIIGVFVDLIVNEWFFKTFLVYFDIFRPRPYTIHPDIMAIGFPFEDSSFPSSHMAFTTLMVMIVTYFERRFLFLGILIILMMWLSRIHNGMHYPTDVLMGILIWLIYGFLGLWSMRKLGLEKKKWWERFYKK
jgi:membrane-associated phospholipid phosphatase